MSGRLVVVVDDDAEVRLMLTYAVAAAGDYHAMPLEDATRLLEVVQDVQPALVLMDVMLPHKSGVEAVEELRAAGEHVPVLLLSAYLPVGDPTGVAASLAGDGAVQFLAKPFQLDDLIAKVNTLALEV